MAVGGHRKFRSSVFATLSSGIIAAMSESQSMPVPGSFLALYERPGRGLSAPMREIAERHEFCEDLAGMMREPARALLLELGITEEDVLERCHRGLREPDAGLSVAEAEWVVRRLAELLA